MKFKEGDKVRCVLPVMGYLREGEVYTVESLRGSRLIKVKDVSYAWRDYRFELVEPTTPVSTEPTQVGTSDGSVDDALSSAVDKPKHYARWAIEPITFIMRNGFEFWRGNIIKYAARAGYKTYDGMDATQSEIADLEKVRRYAEMRINQLKGEVTL